MSFSDILMGNPTVLPAAPFRQPLLRNEILSQLTKYEEPYKY